MNFKLQGATLLALGMMLSTSARADIIYSNLTPNGQMAMASRPGSSEIETADDFVLGAPASITSASFIGLLAPGTTGSFTVQQVVVEIYRVFPLGLRMRRAQSTYPLVSIRRPTWISQSAIARRED